MVSVGPARESDDSRQPVAPVARQNDVHDAPPRSLPTCPASGGRATLRSSWTATAGGPSGSVAAIEGHRRASTVRARPRNAPAGIEQLTLYCLSSENWKRPQQEIDFLMHLLEQYMIEERSTIMDNNVRVRMIGRRTNIPEQVLRDSTRRRDEPQQLGHVAQSGDQLRRSAELVDAVAALATKIAAGKLTLTKSTSKRLPIIFTRPGSTIPICWCARRAKCGSATSCCGRSATRRSG